MIPAIAAAIAVVVVAIAIAMITSWLRDAERGRADARVDAERNAGKIAIATADIATWKAKAAAEKRRADGLDLALDEAAADGDASGARSRVLSRWSRELGAGDDPDAADGGDPGAVHPAPASEGEPGAQPDDHREDH